MMRTYAKRFNISAGIAIVILMAAMLIAAIIPASDAALAEDPANPVITVDSKTAVRAGQTFSVDVVMTSNESGLTALVLEIEYDSDAMTLTNVKRGSALSSMTYTATNSKTAQGYAIRPFKVIWDSMRADKSTGTLLTLTFATKINAERKEYEVGVSYEAQNTKKAYNEPVAIDVTNGTVNLIGGAFTATYKDYNGNILQAKKNYSDGEEPSYTGITPTRAETAEYTYTFENWEAVENGLPYDFEFIATYSATPKPYDVIYYVDGEVYDGDTYDYGTLIPLLDVPEREFYNFSGWCLDEACTEKTADKTVMPARDLKLYGQFVLSVRTDAELIPVITAEAGDIDDNKEVDVVIDMRVNPGLNYLMLTVIYDPTELQYVSTERGTAMADASFNKSPIAEKYAWELSENDTSTGVLMTIKFKVLKEEAVGSYAVTMEYNETGDATFFRDGKLIYSQLELYGTSVTCGSLPEVIGNKNGTKIIVRDEDGHSPSATLIVTESPNNSGFTSDGVKTLCGEDSEIKKVYDVVYEIDGTATQPDGSVTVVIELSEALKSQQNIKILGRYNDGSTALIDATVSDGKCTFMADTLADSYAIVADSIAATDGGAVDRTRLISVMALIAGNVLLAGINLLVMSFIGKKKKKNVKLRSVMPFAPVGLLAVAKADTVMLILIVALAITFVAQFAAMMVSVAKARKLMHKQSKRKMAYNAPAMSPQISDEMVSVDDEPDYVPPPYIDNEVYVANDYGDLTFATLNTQHYMDEDGNIIAPTRNVSRASSQQTRPHGKPSTATATNGKKKKAIKPKFKR